jgi:hypothetical protein
VPYAASAREGQPFRCIRPASAFVAHLIAAARQVPQARQRRRAEPAEVIAAYRAADARLRSRNDQ